jgi:hypothetical protein
MQPREDDDGGLRHGQRGERRTGDRDPAVEQIVIAVIGIEARGDGTRRRDDSGIIRGRGMLEVLCSDAHAGEFRGMRARIRDVRVIVPVLDAVIVPVLDAVVVPVLVRVEVEIEPVVVTVIRLDVLRDTVGVRCEDVVQAEVQVRRDLGPEDPQQHREASPDPGASRAIAGRGAGAAHRRGRGQDSRGASTPPTRRTAIGIARRPTQRRRSGRPTPGVWEALAR